MNIQRVLEAPYVPYPLFTESWQQYADVPAAPGEESQRTPESHLTVSQLCLASAIHGQGEALDAVARVKPVGPALLSLAAHVQKMRGQLDHPWQPYDFSQAPELECDVRHTLVLMGQQQIQDAMAVGEDVDKITDWDQRPMQLGGETLAKTMVLADGTHHVVSERREATELDILAYGHVAARSDRLHFSELLTADGSFSGSHERAAAAVIYHAVAAREENVPVVVEAPAAYGVPNRRSLLLEVPFEDRRIHGLGVRMCTRSSHELGNYLREAFGLFPQQSLNNAPKS